MSDGLLSAAMKSTSIVSTSRLHLPGPMLGLTLGFREAMAYFARSLGVSVMDAPSRSWWTGELRC